MVITFYEKPGCGGNARQKATLTALGHILDVKNILSEKWDKKELREYFGQKEIKDWFNHTAPAIKEGMVKPAEMNEEAALTAMLCDPLLIKRPLMRIKDKKISGFDPKEIESVFCFNVEAPSTCTKEEKCLEPSLALWLRTKGFKENLLDEKYQNGDTPLIVAAREANLDVVKGLIKAGANINAKNNDLTNALWAACFANAYNVIDFLTDLQIDINNQNINGATALIYASSAGKEEIVKKLLAKNADKTLVTLDGFNALELASTKNILDALKSQTNSLSF